jgi:hypothetical protein
MLFFIGKFLLSEGEGRIGQTASSIHQSRGIELVFPCYNRKNNRIGTNYTFKMGQDLQDDKRVRMPRVQVPVRGGGPMVFLI